MDIKKNIRRFLSRIYTTDYFWSVREKAMAGSLLAKLRYPRLQMLHGCSIPFSVQFGSRPSFPHGLSGIFISQGAVIGSDCVIFQQVTIGSNTLPGSKSAGSPVIGDSAYIGAGAKIIGNVHVGSSVRIGANCVVVKDVPDNATVVPAATRVILHDQPQDNRFVAFPEHQGN